MPHKKTPAFITALVGAWADARQFNAETDRLIEWSKELRGIREKMEQNPERVERGSIKKRDMTIIYMNGPQRVSCSVKLKIPAAVEAIAPFFFSSGAMDDRFRAAREPLEKRIVELQEQVLGLENQVKRLTPKPVVPLYLFDVHVSNGEGFEDDVASVEAEYHSIDREGNIVFVVDDKTVAVFPGKVRRIIRTVQNN